MSTETTEATAFGLHCRDCHLYFFGNRRSKCDRCGSGSTCTVPAWSLKGSVLDDGCPALEAQHDD